MAMRGKNIRLLKLYTGLALLCYSTAPAQEAGLWTGTDTLEATVTAYARVRPLQQALPAQHLLRGAQLDLYNKSSLVHSLNTLPGVRMEERSPGSYRLNMRGSSLRAPFGVRNTKVYYNGIPLTDAGGNTYLNQVALHNLSAIEVSKGPGGSMYGAGTGGVVLLHTLQPMQPGTQVELMGGSYGLAHAQVAHRSGTGQQGQALAAGFTRHDGYRVQSNLQRANINYSGSLLHSARHSLQAHLLLTDLRYQTPGGLTRAEWDANPRAARPAAGTQPSAQAARAAIYQQNVLAGLVHKAQWHPSWHWETALFGQYAQVRNPAIRNYEQRSEPGWGLRSVATHTQSKKLYTRHWHSGVEAQWGYYTTRVFTNINGQKGQPISTDDVRFGTWTAFTQLDHTYSTGLQLSGGISFFQNRVGIQRKVPEAAPLQADRLSSWAPRFTVQYPLGKGWLWSAVLSRGFSPPTVAEILPSTGDINTGLLPEHGWNYETGLRWQSANRRWQSSINLFYLQLRNALVQQRDAAGADFFTNAGSTRQPGAEWSGQYYHVRQGKKLQLISLTGAYTFFYFTYRNYTPLGVSYNGNYLPSVPRHTFSWVGQLAWRNSLSVQANVYSNSTLWLNDANTAQAPGFVVPGLRLSYGRKWQLYAGADNLFNATYSLGNDINAFGGRFFNAAPGRNFYTGLRIKIS